MPRAHFSASNQHFRQKHAHRVDAVLEPVQRGELQVLDSEALEHLEPALAGAELLGLRVVRHDVPGIDERPRRKLAHVVPEIDAGGLVVIDDPDLAADHLRKPDGGGVAPQGQTWPSRLLLCTQKQHCRWQCRYGHY
jgi:hypothetical protein